jgi:DNA-binding response OmpR family regulator
MRESAMKLLVVENNMNIQRLYKDELEEEGYDVVLASTGKDAMEKFETEMPDMVTLEMLLPDIDGTALLQLMKESRPNVPVLMATAFDYRDDFASLPSDAYLVKSSDLRELKENIKKFAAPGGYRRDPNIMPGLTGQRSVYGDH